MFHASFFNRPGRARRIALTAFILALVTFAVTGLASLGFTNDYRIFFRDDNPQLVAFRHLEDTYTRTDNVLFVINVDNANLFTSSRLDAIAWLTERAWQLPHVTRVDSITNFQHTTANGDALQVQDLYSPTEAPLDPARLQAVAIAEPLLRNRLIAPSGKVTGININFDIPDDQADTVNPVIVEAVRNLSNEFQTRHPDMTVHLTGMVMFNNAYPEASQRDGETLIPLMFAVIVLLLLVSLRSLTATLLTLGVTVLAVLTALGLAGRLGITLNTASATAPLIIMTLCIANAVHLFRSYRDRLRTHGDRERALNESLKHNFRPILVTNLLTIIGFLTLNFSDSPPFHDLGNITALGVFVGWFYSITILPAAMRRLPIRHQRDTAARSLRLPMSEKLALFVIRNRRAILAGGTLIAMLVMAAIPLNRLDDSFIEDFSRATAFRQDTEYTLAHLTGLYTMEYHLPAPPAGNIADPAYLAVVEKFRQWLAKQPEVRHVTAITDILKRINMNLHGDDPAAYRLPTKPDLAAQYLLLYEMSLPYGLDLNNRIASGKRGSRLTVTLNDISSDAILALEKRAHHWLIEQAPSYLDTTPSSPALMFAHISRNNVRSMLLGTGLSLILISLIMVATLRDWRLGLYSLIPNLLPLGMTFGIWGLLVGEIGLAASTVSAICLGIIVDDTVHFLGKYQWARRQQGLPPDMAIRQTFRWVFGAMTTTSLALAGGFAVLSLSNFAINAEIGLLTTLTIVIAWFADVFYLPALLLWLEYRKPATQDSHSYRATSGLMEKTVPQTSLH